MAQVPLGANLRIEVRDLDRVLAARALVMDGPTLRDEEIVVPIALTTTAPVLVGRLIDEADKPLADGRFGLHIRVGWRTTVETITTNSEGHFELPWHPELDGERLTEAFLVQQLGAGIEVVPNGPSARIPAPTIPATGRVELGAIVMRSPTLQAILAAGVVVDGEDRPIEGAHVLSYSIWPISAEGPWEKYSSLSDATVQSDTDGRFRIVSGASCRGLMIGAQKSGYYLERSLPCEVGRQDLKLVMRTGASLVGNVLLDPEVPRGRVEVQFLNARSRTLSTARLDANGAFALQALRPTQGAVVVKLNAMLLLRIEGIQVAGEGEQRNERLNDIDLRGKLREFRVRIIDSRGGPLESGRRVYLSSREVPTSVAFFMLDERGSGTTWIPASIESVILGAADYAPFEIAAYPDQRTVTLEKRHALVFELAPAVELPAEHHLRVALRLPEGSEFSRIEQLLVNSSRDDLLPDAPVRRGVPHAGRYELHFWVRARLLDREEYVGVLPLEIAAEPDEHVLRVAPQPEDLANAIEKLR